MILQIVLPVLIILFVMLFLNFPIYVALFSCTLYLQIFVNQMPLQNLFNGVFEALTKNSLLAIPFFLVAGNLMATGSLGHRLVDFCYVLLKKIPGGFILSCVVANGIFGAICGSAPAATATFGKIFWTPLRKEFGDEAAAGVITSSGALSPIIPPSLTLIIFALVTELSLSKLFIAGFIPGVVCVLVLFIYVRIKYRKHNANVVREKGEVLKALKYGIPALLLPVIILGGIYGGIFTPTEAGAVSAIYTAIVSVFVIKDISLKDFPKIFVDSGKTIGQLFILIAAGTAFSQALTISQVPNALVESMGDISKMGFLLTLNIMLLILGALIDPGAITLIIAPLALPIAYIVGVDPIHLGIIFAVNLAIGMFTPPFGLNIFVAQSVLKQPMGVIVRGCIPYFFCYIISLIIITYIPQISLVLGTILGT